MPGKTQSFSKSEYLSKQVQRSDKSLLQKIQVFLPISPFMIFWYFLVLIVILMSFSVTVLYICFENLELQNALWTIIFPIVVTIMGLDIIISFNTSFITEGRIISQRKRIAYNYIFSPYFFFDIIAFIISLIQTILRIDFQNGYPLLNFLIYIKIVKISEFDQLIKKYVLKSASQLLYYQMVKNLLLLALVCHVVGSFFFYLDIILIRDQWYSQEYLWIYNSYAFLNIADLGMGWQYAYGFYYAVVTLSGTAYGDLVPLNPTQTAYTFFSVALPMIIYAYLFSVIYNAISERRNRAIEAVKYKKMAKYYFRDLGIEQKLSRRLMNYLSYVYQKKISIDNEFLQNLAPNIKGQYIRSAVDNFYDFSLFDVLTRPQCEIQQIKAIVYNIIRQESFPDKHVISLRKQQIKLYFINTGTIYEIVELKLRKFTKIIESKNFFMQHPFFTGIFSMKVNNWYEPKQFTISQVIDLEQFMDEVRKNQPLKQAHSMLKQQILLGDLVSCIKTRCFFCDQINHILPNCPKLRPKIKILKVINRKVQRNQINHRLFYYRKKFHDRSSNFCIGSSQKTMILKQLSNIRKFSSIQQTNNQLNNKQIQTDSEISINFHSKSDNIKMHHFGVKEKTFQCINNWRIYKPIYNFSH